MEQFLDIGTFTLTLAIDDFRHFVKETRVEFILFDSLGRMNKWGSKLINLFLERMNSLM